MAAWQTAAPAQQLSSTAILFRMMGLVGVLFLGVLFLG